MIVTFRSSGCPRPAGNHSGSVKGWVATVEHDCRINLTNLNPFTCQPRRHILPSLHDAVCDQKVRFVWKLCLPSSPTEDPKGVAVAIYGSERLLAFTRLGSRAWTTISRSLGRIPDVVSYKGRFYAVNIYGDVTELNLQCQETVKIASRPMERLGFPHLVESAEDLLQVVEFSRTNYLKVFKLHLGSQEWEAVTSLGERSLFLSKHNRTSVSINAPELSGCRSNCIYLINDYYIDVEHEKNSDGFLLYSLEEDDVVERQHMGQTCKNRQKN